MKARASHIAETGNAQQLLKIENRGVSLIEMLVALLIASIISSAAYNIFTSVNRSYTAQNVASKVQQRVRVAIDFMVRDIRMAGLDPLRTANAGVISATPTVFNFTADKNMDGDTDDAAEDMTYSVVGGNLQLTDDQGTETLAEYVTNFSYSYLDKDGVATMNTDDIRSVEISLTVQEPAGAGKRVSRTYNTQVRCRNLGL